MTALEIPHLAAINSLPTSLLYPHQADGVSFLISKGRAILGDDMGLGHGSSITVVIFCWHILLISESMDHHDSEIMDDRSID